MCSRELLLSEACVVKPSKEYLEKTDFDEYQDNMFYPHELQLEEPANVPAAAENTASTGSVEEPVEESESVEPPETPDQEPCFTFDEERNRLTFLVPSNELQRMSVSEFKEYFSDVLRKILEENPDMIIVPRITVQARAVTENGEMICPCCLSLLPEDTTLPFELPIDVNLDENYELQDIVATEPQVWPGFMVHGLWVPFVHFCNY